MLGGPRGVGSVRDGGPGVVRPRRQLHRRRDRQEPPRLLPGVRHPPVKKFYLHLVPESSRAPPANRTLSLLLKDMQDLGYLSYAASEFSEYCVCNACWYSLLFHEDLTERVLIEQIYMIADVLPDIGLFLAANCIDVTDLIQGSRPGDIR